MPLSVESKHSVWSFFSIKKKRIFGNLRKGLSTLHLTITPFIPLSPEIKEMKKLHWTVYLTLVIILGCNQLSEYSTDSKVSTSKKEEDGFVCSPANSLLETEKSQIGMKAVAKHGYLKTRSLLNELHIIVDGFKITPLLKLGSWVTFTPYLDSAVVIGDVITTETDLASVEREVVAHGLTIRDIHKYPSRDGSIILFMHINGFGNVTGLSRSVKALISKLTGGSDKSPREGKGNTVINNLNRSKLDSILGRMGEVEGDVYKYTIGRLDVFKAYGIPTSTFLEFNTWAAWQGTDEKAVVAGDFTMLGNEVSPVIKALAENGFELVHNQIVHEQPDILCLHYLGVGNAEKLAKGLKAAFDQQER